jgi:hypothetical protein
MTDQQPAAPPAPPKTATEAQTVLAALKADPVWSERFLGGDVTATKDFRDLTALAAVGGDDTVAVAMSGNPVNMPTTELAHISHTAAMFRELGIRTEVASQFLRDEPVSALEYELVSNWKKEHMGDEDFVKRFLSGGIKERQQMLIANSVLVNGIKRTAA